MPVFPAPLVLDPVTLTPRKEQVGEPVTVVLPGTTTPVSPLLAYGSGEEIVGAVLYVTELYALTPFVTPDGVYEVEILAVDGIRSFLDASSRFTQAAAEEARDAAVEAAGRAQDAADAAAEIQGLPTAGKVAGGYLYSQSADPADNVWTTAAPGGGGGGGGSIMEWRYAGGAWPTLPSSKPAGITTVLAFGPRTSWPTTLPSWVGVTAGKALLIFIGSDALS